MYSPKEESTIYKLLAAEGIVPANTHVIQLTEAMVEMVKAGLGFAFLARWAVEPQVRAGTIRAIPLYAPRLPPDVERRHTEGHGARAVRPRVHRSARRASTFSGKDKQTQELRNSGTEELRNSGTVPQLSRSRGPAPRFQSELVRGLAIDAPRV